MTQPLPNDGVSAFFDEELSPSEHDAVAHHLSQSPAAQRELAEIRRLSEELRNLPTERVPCDLRSRVLNQLAPTPASSPVISGSVVIVVGKWLAAVAAMGLFVAWLPSIWNGSEPVDSFPSIAARSPESVEADFPREATPSTGLARKKPAKSPQRVHLGAEGELLSQNQNLRSLAIPQGSPAKDTNRERFDENLQVPADSPMRPSVAAANFADPIGEKDRADVTDPQVARILEWAARARERVVIVEISTGDIQETLTQVQTLLAQNAVVPANFPMIPDGLPTTKEAQKPAPEDSRLSLYAQATPHQFSTVLSQLRAQNPGSQFQPQTTLALEDIPLWENEEERLNRRGNTARFRQSLAQSIKRFESGQAGPRFGIGPQTAGDKASSDAIQEEAKTPGEPRASGIMQTAPSPVAPALGTFSLQAAAPELPQSLAESRSFQMMIQTPADQWLKKPADDRESLSGETKPEDSLAGRKQVNPNQPVEFAEIAGGKAVAAPVRLLFLFREQSPAK